MMDIDKCDHDWHTVKTKDGGSVSHCSRYELLEGNYNLLNGKCKLGFNPCPWSGYIVLNRDGKEIVKNWKQEV